MGSTRFALALGGLAFCLSAMLYAPALWVGPSGRFYDLLALAEAPFGATLREPILANRPLVPLILHAFGLGAGGLVAIQYAAVMVFLALAAALLRGAGVSATHTVGTTLGLGATQATQVSVVWLGVPDAFTHALLCLSLLVRWPPASAAAAVAALLNDERAALAFPFLVLWRRLDAGAWGSAARMAASLTAALSLWAGCRWIMFLGSSPVVRGAYDGDLFVSFVGSGPWFAAAWFSLRGAWLPTLWGLLALASQAKVDAVLAISAILFAWVASGFVADMSRSLSFTFPAVLLAIRSHPRGRSSRSLAWILAGLALSLLTPQFSVVGTHYQWLRPLPVALARWIGG